MTHEEILEQLDRLANGDAFNDPESLIGSLEMLIIELKKLTPNT